MIAAEKGTTYVGYGIAIETTSTGGGISIPAKGLAGTRGSLVGRMGGHKDREASGRCQETLFTSETNSSHHRAPSFCGDAGDISRAGQARMHTQGSHEMWHEQYVVRRMQEPRIAIPRGLSLTGRLPPRVAITPPPPPGNPPDFRCTRPLQCGGL
jgi:hypothetical protein